MKAMWTLVGVFIALALLGLSKAVQGTECSSDVTAEESKEFAKQSSKFAFDLYQQILNNRAEEQNLFFSPASIYTALGMLHVGAKGETAKELRSALYATLNATSLPSLHYTMLQEYNKTPESTKKLPFELNMANALYSEQTYTIKKEFQDTLQNCFQANATAVDFLNEPEAQRTLINNYVESKTNDKIKNLLPPDSIEAQTKAVLVNAIYFKANWQHTFDKEKTKKGDFQLLNGEKIQVDMMSDDPNPHFSYPYYNDDDVQVLGIPYKSYQLYMMIILPKDPTKFLDFEKQVTGAKVLDYIERADEGRTPIKLVSIPKFKVEDEFKLKAYLGALGIQQVFTDAADLSTMAENLKVNEGYHKSFVKVDEMGTEAAAATGLATVLYSLPPEPKVIFVANKPFIYAIRHPSTSTLLFVGRLANPSQME